MIPVDHDGTQTLEASAGTRVLVAAVMALNGVLLWMLTMLASTGIASLSSLDWKALAIPSTVLIASGLGLGMWRIRRISVSVDHDEIIVRNVWTTRRSATKSVSGARIGAFPLDWLPWRAFGTVPMLILRTDSETELPLLVSASDRSRAGHEVLNFLAERGVHHLPDQREWKRCR